MVNGVELWAMNFKVSLHKILTIYVSTSKPTQNMISDDSGSFTIVGL